MKDNIGSIDYILIFNWFSVLSLPVQLVMTFHILLFQLEIINF